MGDEEEEASLGATRYPVMPSLVALQQMRNRLHLAQLGKKLMKWTALATGKELRRLSIEMTVAMKDYGAKMKAAFILLARARYFVPSMNGTVIETIPKQACVTVTTTARSVSGVKVKDMHVAELGCDYYQYLGMSKGGMVIRECKEAWLDLIKLMVLLCQYRVTFRLIDVANRNATKKQNVLERCVIPRIKITMRYILSELDEREREETFRLKRFKQLKYKNLKKAKKVEDDEEEPKEVELRPKPKAVVKLAPKPEPKVESKPEPIPKPKSARKPEPILEPIKILEPPKLHSLELLMTHLYEVVRLAEQLETEPIPQKDVGLTICDLGQLKVQLKKLIEASEGPHKDRVCTKCGNIGRTVSSCSCQTTFAPLKPVVGGDFKTVKPDGFEAALNLMPKSKVKTTIPDYILKPRPMIDPMADSKPLDLHSMSKNRIDELERHVNQVICMTNRYQCEGLLSKSAEDFLKCCKSVKIKIHEFRCQKLVKAKLDRLKAQVTKLEEITNIVQKEDLSTTTVTSFVSCCKGFRAKLDSLKSCRGTPSVSSIEKLLNKIDYSIVLSKEAKEKGLVSESVEEFIKSCVEIKTKIEPHNEPKPQVIDDLLLNLNDIIDFISKYKDGALLSDSIETFYKNCRTTKAKLDSYKPCPAPFSGKNTYPKTLRANSASCPCTAASSHAPSGYSYSPGTSVCSGQGNTTTWGQSAENQQSQRSSKSKLTPCTESTCVHKQPSPRSRKSYQSASPEKSVSAESGCNICAVRSGSEISVKIALPREGCIKKAPKKAVNTKTKVRTYKEVDGSIVEETVTVKHRVYDPQKLSETSCRSCGSRKSDKKVHLCKIPVTKGFIQTVRNIKSETLIRSLDLSSSYPPILWSCVSADTLISLKRSDENEIFAQDPFFCASSTTKDDDSVLPI